MPNDTSKIAGLVATGVLGAAVLGSYGVQRDAQALWGALRGPLFAHWTFSALLTAACFLYVIAYVYFLADPYTRVWDRMNLEEARDAWLPVLLTFLVSAAAWAWLTVRAQRTKRGRGAVTFVLWVTAAAAVTMFVLLAGAREPELGWKQPLAVLAASVVAYHHWVWDAVVWDSTWA